MKTEQQVARYVCSTRFEDLPEAAVTSTKELLLTDLGTVIAGGFAEGCETLVSEAKRRGGAPEASILVHGGKVPAEQAAFVNAYIARALDYCDSMAPGAHPGTATIPAALAAAEVAGGASGADFLAAVAVGTELSVRLNLGEAEYDGFDPTGIVAPFASTAAAARILGLSEEQTLNALGLAFCHCGGSFQANVDGVLAVRIIEGWSAETGVTCARLAGRGFTGPGNFLDGVYGYFHLFGRDRVDARSLLDGLGRDFRIRDTLVFKKYPSCGATQSSTELVLNWMAETGLAAPDVAAVHFTVPPYIYKLVGHPFQFGSNPKVNAQFSIRFCAANALTRGGSKLAHFESDAISDPGVLELVQRIEVVPDAALDARGHTAVDMRVTTKDGREYLRQIDLGPGYPGRWLSREEHLQHFRECVEFTAQPPSADDTDALVAALDHLEELGDVRELIPLFAPAR